ncbi:MAG: DNA repair protein RecO [Candidatus Omnitrophica bacterium]|jgi:DNA repair protein RecO (recombination protein O)|nr:DNA repair protein RecO [Candidatus Omnitrophota bacterium]MDD5725339.1 DNA repair protein RecO [Candidatus Omnitrophota bacterium]
MSIEKAEGLVLNRKDLRETSLIVDFYTREFGKISGVLKGIRTDPGKFASNLEHFSLNEIIFYRKTRSSLHLVSQADKTEDFTRIRQSIDRAAAAGFMMELVNSVMQPEDKNEEVFDLAVSCLKELETNYSPDKISTIFKIKMLNLSGFKPHFDSCVSCLEKVTGQSKFSLSLGGLLCPRCAPKDPASRWIFRGTIATVLHIERNGFAQSLNLGMNPQIKKELDLILNSFLNFHLGRELKSQKLIHKLAAPVA